MTNALAVTAHHDDAVLWLGGTILQTRALGWNWTVISLCISDCERQQFFTDYCYSVGVGAFPACLHDYQSDPPFSKNSLQAMTDAISAVTGKTRFDWVFTHCRDRTGEYGYHANHFEVSVATRSLVHENRLCSGFDHLVHFAYAPIYGCDGRATVAQLEADYFVQLNYYELLQKCAWCMAAPDACTNLRAIGFPCPNPEAFVTHRAKLPDPFIP